MGGNATKNYVDRHSSGGGGGGGTTNYNELENKPSINGVTLSGNKTSADLNISSGGGSLHAFNTNIAVMGNTLINQTFDLSSLNFNNANYAIVGYETDYNTASLIFEIQSKTATSLNVYIRNVSSDDMYATVTLYIAKF